MSLPKPYYQDDWATIYHGDCREILPMLKPVNLVVTSPPYNMRTRIRNGEYTERERSEHFSKKYRYFHDSYPIDEYLNIHRGVLGGCLQLAQLVFVNIAIVTGSKEAWFTIIGQFANQLRDVFVWDKGKAEPAMHPAVVNRGYELILAFESDAVAGRAFNISYFDRGTMPDVWRVNRNGDAPVDGHGANFPCALAAIILNGWSRPGDSVIDCFMGTGTTLRAAKDLRRKSIGIEIEERYCEIAAQRLAQEVLL